MKFLGNISHLSSSGRLIARSSQSPPSGVSVFNKNKKKIGKIVDVFGPTKEPYISVGVFKSINIKDFENSIGEDLFMSDSFKKNRKDPKNKSKSSSKNIGGRNSKSGRSSNNREGSKDRRSSKSGRSSKDRRSSNNREGFKGRRSSKNRKDSKDRSKKHSKKQ